MISTKSSPIRLAELLTPISRRVRLEPDTIYRSLGVKWYAKGLFIKEPALGREIKAKHLFLIKDGDFVYNRLFAWKGSFALADAQHEGSVVSGEFPIFRINVRRLVPKYLMAFFSTPILWEFIARQSSGTAEVSRLRFKETEFLQLAIPLPPKEEQERIVMLLDEANELRKSRTLADCHTADLIPSIYQEMFGNKEWPIRNMAELIEGFRYGTSIKSTEKGYPTLRIPNVVRQQVDLTDLKYVSVSKDEFERLKLRAGDLLFVRTNGNPDNVGRCAVFDRADLGGHPCEGEDFIFASYLIRARPKSNIVSPQFVQQYLVTSAGRESLRSRSRTSAGQYNINVAGLSDIAIPLPPLNLQQEFVARAAEVREMNAKQVTSGRRLDDLFRSLLDKAFKGEL